MFKSRVLLCLFKNVIRIPKDFKTKSNFIHEYNLIFTDTSNNEVNNKKINIKLLYDSIINSNISVYSPFDSALFFSSLNLAFDKGHKIDFNDVSYKKARDLLLRDMAKYRNELIPYFIDKLTLIRDANGLTTYLSGLSSKSIEIFNPSMLCEIIIKLTKTFKNSKSPALREMLLNSDFFTNAISKLANLSMNNSDLINQFTPQNIFKAIYGLAKLDSINESSTTLLSNLIPIVSRHLESDPPWDSKTILRIAWAYHKFDLINEDLFSRIASLIMHNLDDFDCKEIGRIQEIYTRESIWNERLLLLTKSRLETFLKYGAYSGQFD